jgi:hypothetical protein
MARPKKQPQMSFSEEPLDNAELALLLQGREDASADMEPYRLKYKGLDSQVKGIIEELELPDGSYRCGRYIVKISETEEKEVSFERKSSRRISIRPAKT